MRSAREGRLRNLAGIFATVGLAFALTDAASAHQDTTEAAEPHDAPATQASPKPSAMEEGSSGTMSPSPIDIPGMPSMHFPRLDPERGKTLFVEKGCVACHAVNGVGGHDASALDAHAERPIMNPFEFAAVMWRMAPAMIYAQEEALGEQILFSGEELADIYAFLHTDEVQHHFSESDIPPRIEKLMHHTHGEPGGGAKAHGADIGHHHDEDSAPHED